MNTRLNQLNYSRFTISICIYYKDDPVFFEKAVTSIIEMQTLKPNEVISVVDGSIEGVLKDNGKAF